MAAKLMAPDQRALKMAALTERAQAPVEAAPEAVEAEMAPDPEAILTALQAVVEAEVDETKKAQLQDLLTQLQALLTAEAPMASEAMSDE